MFTVDGVSYNVLITGLTRNFAALDREDTGRSTSTGTMIRSIIGSFYTYDITLETKNLSETQYDTLYEVLTSPDEFHSFTLPYGQATYSFDGYVASASDAIKRISGNKKFWGGLSFSIVPKTAKRRP